MIDDQIKRKSRSQNNFHCFEGSGLAFWYAIAEGRSNDVMLKNGRDGYYVHIPADVDGFLLLNGGISSPDEAVLDDRAVYYRFYSSVLRRKFGNLGWRGHWWINENAFQYLQSIARETSQPLSRVARNFLAVPPEWNDCAHVVRAILNVKLKAWVGPGRIAHPFVSPASEKRPDYPGRLYGVTPRISPKQLFIPGAVFYEEDKNQSDFQRFFTILQDQRTDIA